MARTYRNKLRFELDDYIKANRIGSRNAEIENQSGWYGKGKVHKSKRIYTRKEKHKNLLNL